MKWIGTRPLAAAFAVVCLCIPAIADAEVTQFSVISRDRPALDGRSFGPYGTTEKITARATIAVDPNDPHDAVIADIGLAPRNPQGRVEATADVVILRPTEGGNGTLLLEMPNRGRKLMPMLFDDALEAPAQRLERADDAGLGFLLSQGYTLAWVGWQSDLQAGPNVMRIQTPTLPNVTGVSREEFVFDHSRNPVTAPLTYPAAAMPGDGVVTVRAHTDDARERPADLSFPRVGRINIAQILVELGDAPPPRRTISNRPDPRLPDLGRGHRRCPDGIALGVPSPSCGPQLDLGRTS